MSRLPIDVVPGSCPARFRWDTVVDTPDGSRIVDNDSPIMPASVEKAVVDLIALCKKLQAFKDWVHAYLDARGIPTAPEGTHGASGCRIGDRMDWLMAEMDKLREEVHSVAAKGRRAKG